MRINTQIKKKCETCSVEFFVIKSRRFSARFCSAKCKIPSSKTRKLLSLKSIGRKKTSEHRRKISVAVSSENNGMWKGNKAGLDAIHVWVTKRFPKTKLCQACKKVPPLDLANVSQKYKRVVSDWIWLCRKCHMLSDGRLSKLSRKEQPVLIIGTP